MVTRLTEHDDVTKSLLRGAPRLGLGLGPASARAGPDGNRLDMNKTGGNAIRLKLINLQTALKKLADKHHRKVVNGWNQLFFWKCITSKLQMPLHSFSFFVLFCANWVARLYFITTEIIFKRK